MERIIVIAVDGESGAGKGTLSSLLARALGIEHWNSGLSYRAIGLACEEEKVDPVELIEKNMAWWPYLTHQDVSTDRGGKAASHVAQVPVVRDAVNKYGRRMMSNPPGCVVDGRSGAWEFPEIPIKIYLTCNLDERTRRRCMLIGKQGGIADYNEVRENLRQRDHADRAREIFPLERHPQAHHLDNTAWSSAETLAEAMRYYIVRM